MKIRKHKNNKSFDIHFTTCSSRVISNRGNVGGWEKRALVCDSRGTLRDVQGISAGAVLNGFLFGRDRNNVGYAVCPAGTRIALKLRILVLPFVPEV